MKRHFPKGKTLTALEKNILKLRLFEMGLVLYYVEELKRDTLASVRATHPKLFPSGTKNVYEKMWEHLVANGVISQVESAELQEFINYRNDIAHNIYTLTGDICRDPGILEIAESFCDKYKSDALGKITCYRKKISNGMMSRYRGVISIRGLLFEAAEKTYEEEIKRLRVKITKQARKYKEEIKTINAELRLVPSEFYEKYEHWKVVKNNGALSDYGKAVCRQLFQYGLGPLAAAYVTKTGYSAMKTQMALL